MTAINFLLLHRRQILSPWPCVGLREEPVEIVVPLDQGGVHLGSEGRALVLALDLVAELVIEERLDDVRFDVEDLPQ